MFGGNCNNSSRESLSTVMTPANPPVKKSGGSSVTGFDPEGLERAAKGARDLDVGRNASQAIELIKTQ
jgi:ATPase family AAA domain-containing protein 3A/B